MKKHLFYIVVLIMCSSCFNQNTSSFSQSESSSTMQKDSIVDAEAFLKNTTYIFYGLSSIGVNVRNFEYTPPKSTYFKSVTVKIDLDNNSAVITTDYELKCNIINIEYKRMENDFVKTYAIINTNKGTILISKSNRDYYLHFREIDKKYTIEGGLPDKIMLNAFPDFYKY